MTTSLSISGARHRIATGTTHRGLIDEVLEHAAADDAAHVFIAIDGDGARAAADAADVRLARDGIYALPSLIAGLPVTVKDLFDIEGEITRAGSRVRDDAEPARDDAVVVARLRSAGAAIVGRTNMTEFAFSGVGINPHFGTPRNPADVKTVRIPGGSSSGAAVSVALGLAVAALGSDTGGSIRIPAALCGIVGFKPTQSRVPLRGAFPLSRTLDTASAMTACVTDALAIDALIADAPLAVEGPANPRALRLVVPQTVVLDGLDRDVSEAFDRALRTIADAGATIIELPLAEFAERDRMKIVGGFSSPESWAVHRALLATSRDRYDPRVVSRIERGQDVSAADYLDLIDARADWIARVESRLEGFDALLCPTVPMVAPAMQPLIDDDAAFFKANALLLRNTSLINLLDGCSFSLPCHRVGQLPIGLMLSSTRGRDSVLASAALAIEAVLEGR
jgi:aspartyl-tRNA(Asn)/glutamyl-tRNA(Gln) amidotransferase subunit A